jgi:hypothetical protein
MENGKKLIENFNFFVSQYFFHEMLGEECRCDSNAEHHQMGKVWD